MKVTGFTIARNAVKYGYPIKESIQSILPICDEFIVSVGDSEDNTLEYLQEINSPKIKFIESTWDETFMDGGKVLAVETNKAFHAIDEETDWCFYIQADEAVHEKYLPNIKDAMTRYLNDNRVEGLLFKYHHFYHSYHYIGVSSSFYKNEIRVIRNSKSIYSYRDAQGFRIDDDRKLNVIPIDAYIFHYGFVRPPEKMYKKQESMLKWYYDDEYIQNKLDQPNSYDYTKRDAYLIPFTETHPELMKESINQMDWDFDINRYRKGYSLKDRFKLFLKKFTPINPDYENYKII